MLQKINVLILHLEAIAPDKVSGERIEIQVKGNNRIRDEDDLFLELSNRVEEALEKVMEALK